MQSIVKKIRQDHNRILSGLDDIRERRRQPGRGTPNEPFRLVQRQVLMHTYGEEQILYPLLREAATDTVQQAEEAHRAIQRRMQEMLRVWSSEDEWERSIQELRDSLVNHFSVEEEVLLPELLDKFSHDDLVNLGSQFDDAKHRTPGVGPLAAGQSGPPL